MNVYDRKAPCKECADRKVGCHSTCPKYTEWKAKAVQEPKREFYKLNAHKKGRRF